MGKPLELNFMKKKNPSSRGSNQALTDPYTELADLPGARSSMKTLKKPQLRSCTVTYFKCLKGKTNVSGQTNESDGETRVLTQL